MAQGDQAPSNGVRSKAAGGRHSGAGDFGAIAARLRRILEPYASSMIVTGDGPSGYSLDLPPTEHYPHGLFFAGVRVGRTYVSFHLMPIYALPNLNDRLSPALRPRMQGKSCFNFTKVDERLFEELSAVTAASVEPFRAFTERPRPPSGRGSH